MTDKDLPKGLMEFGSTLGDPEFSGELMKRLLDLPENGLRVVVAKHATALKEIKQAERVLAEKRAAAREIAQSTFRTVLKNWSVEEIQKATGYDDE